MKELNDKEKRMFDYINACITDEGYSPSVREIQSALGIKSTATVHSYIERLHEKGYLTKNSYKSRSIRPENSAPVYRVPVLGRVTAGQPVLAVEQLEDYISFSATGHRYAHDSLFALRVSGKSMIEAGILDGDTVIVERCQTAENGQIIVALIDDEATVKTFYKEQGHFRLQPENKTMNPIIVDHVAVLGRVVANIRHY